MAFDLGSGVIRIAADMKPLLATLGAARYQLARFVAGTRTLAELSGFVGAFGTVGAVYALTKGFIDANQAAAHLEETMNRIEVVFGSSARVILEFADQMAAKFGYLKKPILEAASAFGEFGLAAGMTKKEAAQFSQAMARAAIDAQSFFDVPIATATQKILAGLAGMPRPLREWGSLLNATQVKQEALRLGLAKTTGTISEQDKVLARSILILKDLQIVEGDAARTINSTQRLTDSAIGRIGNAFTNLGMALKPLWHGIMKGLDNSAQGFQAFINRNMSAITSWSEWVVSTVSKFVRFFQPVWNALSDGWNRFWAALVAETNKTMGAISRAFGKEGETSADMVHSLADGVTYLADAVIGLIGVWGQFREMFADTLVVGLDLLYGIAIAVEGIAYAFKGIAQFISDTIELIAVLNNSIMDVVEAVGEKLVGVAPNLDQFRMQERDAGKGNKKAKRRGIGEIAADVKAADFAKDNDARRELNEPEEGKKKGSVFSSFEEFYKKLQAGSGEKIAKEQLGELKGANENLMAIVNAMKNAKNPIAVAGGR